MRRDIVSLLWSSLLFFVLDLFLQVFMIFFFIVSYCFVAPLIKSHLLKMEASLLVTLFAIEKACVIFNIKKN